MPNNDDNVRRIRILASIASAIYNHGRGIFIAGTGQDIYGEDVANVASEIETIPADTDGYRWANASARFIRWVLTILQVALQEDHDMQTQNILNAINQNLDGLGLDEENVDPDL